MYAVVETGGKQYKVTAGQIIDVEKLPVAPGESVTLDQVLLVADGDEHGLGRKAVIFHYRPKQRYRVERGHRQQYTRLRIDKIKT